MKNPSNRDWTILLVDDDEDDYVLLSMMLSRVWKDRAVIHWVVDPKNAIERACSNIFDAAILDSQLDHTSGIDLIESIYKACPTVPLIFISNWTDPLIIDQALAKGASAAISKAQLSGESLVQVIEDVVKIKPARQPDALD